MVPASSTGWEAKLCRQETAESAGLIHIPAVAQGSMLACWVTQSIAKNYSGPSAVRGLKGLQTGGHWRGLQPSFCPYPNVHSASTYQMPSICQVLLKALGVQM